jgi:nucleotide-binding universal stress UspA family protein
VLFRSSDLLAYDEIRQKFRLIESARQQLEEIPLDRIVGSVNRYTDFTRNFLPRHASDLRRWAFVRMGVESSMGLPPIEAYKIGEVYFILDGHHRVSVAREMGQDTIQGYVTQVFTRVPLSPGDSPDDIILKAEYDDFLTNTHLDDLRPGANLFVTAPGQYQKLIEHISVHRFFMGENRGKEIPYPDAVSDWYDTVYQPIAELIRSRNLLRDFPGRTEADLYLWIMDYRKELSGGDLGWEVQPERAASALVAEHSPIPSRRLPRIAHKILSWITPDPLDSGPRPGYWRSEHQSPRRNDHLFDDILVTVPGDSKSWPAVQMAIEVARREEARLSGIHFPGTDQTRANLLPMVEDEFNRRCAEAGISGRLIVETGKAASLLCQRSPWMDLIVFSLNFPPPSQWIRRLRSGSRLLIRRSSSPIMAVPNTQFHLNSALLAYGPGRKSNEALFVATYLAGKWNIPLTVITAQRERTSLHIDNKTTDIQSETSRLSPLENARQYLETHGVKATYVEETGDPARAILLNAETYSADFIIMGGYEANPLLESLSGSSVDRVIRSTRRPTLICR